MLIRNEGQIQRESARCQDRVQHRHEADRRRRERRDSHRHRGNARLRGSQALLRRRHHPHKALHLPRVHQNHPQRVALPPQVPARHRVRQRLRDALLPAHRRAPQGSRKSDPSAPEKTRENETPRSLLSAADKSGAEEFYRPDGEADPGDSDGVDLRAYR